MSSSLSSLFRFSFLFVNVLLGPIFYNATIEVDVITEDFNWEEIGVISNSGTGSNRESIRKSTHTSFLWGGHNAATSGENIEAVTGGVEFKGIGDNASNKSGSYIYTIFSSNSDSSPTQSIDLTDVGATIKIYFKEADPDQSFRFLIRDGSGFWFLSQTDYSNGWWSDVQGLGTPKVIEENYTNVHKAFPVNTFLWKQLEGPIQENLNQLNANDNLDITTNESFSNPDLSNITGVGLYIEEPVSNIQNPLRIEKIELHKKEALVIYNPAYSSHYITSMNKKVKWGFSNLGGGGSGEFYYPEAHPTQNLNASGWGRAFQSAWRSFYHDGGYNPTQGGRTRNHGAPTEMSYSTSSTGGSNNSRINYGPFRVPTMGRPGTADQPFDILTNWDLTNGKIPGSYDLTEGSDDDEIDESNLSEEDEVITEYRMSGFYEDISNIIDDSQAEGIRIYNQYDYFDDPSMIYQYESQLKSNFTNGIRDMVAYTEEAELPNAVRPTRIGIFWGDRLWSEKFTKAWVLNSSDESWSIYDVNSPTDPGGDWGTTHERLTIISGPGGADDAYAVGMYFPEWSNFNQNCIAGVEYETGNILYEEDRVVPDSFEYRFGIRGEGADIYEQGSANIIKAFVKRDLGFQIVGMVEPRTINETKVYERLRLELFHLVGTPNQIKNAVDALDDYYSLVLPEIITLIDTDSDNIIKGTDEITITATFSENMASNPSITIGNLVTNDAMSVGSQDNIWLYTWDVPSDFDGDVTATVSGTDLAGNAYSGSDQVIFTIDNTPPTVQLTTSDSDNIISDSESITITANFSESMASSPTITIGDIVFNQTMTIGADNTAWTYLWNVPTGLNENLSVSIEGSDIAGNAYNGNDKIIFTINNRIPTVFNSTAITDEDTAVEITLTGSDLDGDDLTFSVGEASNGTVSREGAVVTYTPDENFNGTDSFTYTASDAEATSSAATVTITVTAVNDAPTVADVTKTTDEDTAVEITLTGTDLDGDDLTFSVGEAADGTVTLEDAVATYTPDANFTGTDSFTYTASDSEATSSAATVTITVTAVNDAPTVADVTITTDEDTAVEITLTGTDLDGDDLTYTKTNPEHGTVSLDGSVVTYTPDVNFTGTDSFTYTASDGTTDSDEATVTITVTAVNDAPTVADLTKTTDEDTAVEITLTGTDLDGDDLTFSVGEAANGTVTLEGAVATYTPDANFTGTDSFTYTASDAEATSSAATVTITVTAVNDAPTVADVTTTTDEDTTVEITLTGSDLDGDDLTFSVSEAANGTVTLEDAVATYTPNTNFNGTDTFTYTASDSEATSSAATVTITVTAVNDAPTVADVTAEVASQGEVSITLVGNDVDTESLTFEIIGQPEYGTIEIEGSTVNYTNTSYKQTEDRFTYKANDGSLDSEVGEVVITITPYPEIEVSSTVVESACGALEGSILITTKNLVGDVTYNWTGPDDFEATTQNISGLNPGNYSLTISDDIATKSFEFTVSEKPIYQDLEICYVTTDENSNHNKIVLKYPGIYNDKSYQILREGTEAGIYEFIGEINSGETSFLDTTSNNTSRIYSYKVRLKDNCDNLSEQSDYHRTILLQSSVATDNSVNLNWSEYEGRSYSSYLIYRSVNDDPFEEIATISSNSTSYNDTEADISTNAYTYYIAIKVNSCAVETITSSKKAKRSLPLISLATEDAIEIQSNRKEIATLNNPPTVQPVSFVTDEDTAVVVTLSGSDEDDDTLSFSASEPDHGTVTISGSSLTYTPDADYFGVDSFTYTANDGGLTSEAAQVEVTISPINDKPALAAISELSFSEDSPIGTVITTLEATDIDSEAISYTISADANNYFELDGAVVKLKSSLDFEREPIVTVNVIATDGELPDTKELVVNVEDVPNNSVEQEYSITVYDVANEDNTEKLDYTQWTNSTESSGSGDFIFEISGGEDAALFTIDPITGALDFIEAPDYENPSDANGDNVYIVIVKITNINDGAPEIPVVSSQTSVAVPEAQTAAADVDAINTTNDTDTDQDGVVDTEDNCPTTYNPDQEDMDGDGIGDVCDDSDMDTFFDVFDQCPNSAYGVTVDAKGCEVFALPANTFSVSVTSATCPDSSNGSITISSSNTDYSYRYAIDEQAPVALNDNTQTISNLSAGIYTICVTVDGVADYQRCYTIEITEPAPLVASSRIDVSTRNMQLDLSGSSEYQVTLNDKTFLTSEDKLSLNLQPGMNRLEVATALDCQGVYFEEIFVSEEVKVYPNPTSGPLQLFVAGSDSEVELSITTLSGNVIRRETLSVPANRIIETTLGNLPEGLYLITLNGTTVKTTHKVIKE